MTETGDNPAAAGRGRKSASAFRTISEVAAELDLPQHVLRFWETKFSVIRPMKRGGGRRYYRPEDVTLLRSISSLLYTDGYTIKGVQKLLREGSGKLEPPSAEQAPASSPPEPAASAGGGDAALKGELEGVVGELEDIRSLLRGADA
ncbi:MAG: MerR family transcriptional regulator [Rhodospirillaceae bacterium]|jgi:DNA-binding transcriptional MerR regulator|nr:MerR family transcriptional regulator [Rhodospirillaceae bacterium]|tara:strand:+ start:5116 stop:5556 length:441 start_codon:yes stop_codon:yes gene_type:complete